VYSAGGRCSLLDFDFDVEHHTYISVLAFCAWDVRAAISSVQYFAARSGVCGLHGAVALSCGSYRLLQHRIFYDSKQACVIAVVAFVCAALLPQVAVADRTALILDIFSQRARTREGKLQVGCC
jgi:hypothetical protein